MADILLYGANGYTGALIAEAAVKAGLRPCLAGRSAPAVLALAQRLDLPHRVFVLEDTEALETALSEVPLVLNCAGPFHRTYDSMTRACLRLGRHYLDITGEPDVLQGCATLDSAARNAGIMVMPGCGFDVVPTDCAAAMLKTELSDASKLILAFTTAAGASRGTMRTAVEAGLARNALVLEDGHLRELSHLKERQIDFGDGPRTAIATTWGDLITAPHTTGINSVEVYLAPDREAERLMRTPLWIRKVLASRFGRGMVMRQIARRPPGPDANARATRRCRVFGEARASDGQTARVLLDLPENYQFTVLAALEIVRRVLNGQARPGYRTPAGLFGAGLVLDLPGAKRL